MWDAGPLTVMQGDMQALAPISPQSHQWPWPIRGARMGKDRKRGGVRKTRKRFLSLATFLSHSGPQSVPSSAGGVESQRKDLS